MFRLVARASVLVTACTSLVGLAACGSSGGGKTAAASTALKFSQCMRAHGVSNFPDPGAGGGLKITPQSGLNPQSPSFQAAQKACGRFGPGGALPHMSESEKLAALHFAECMRAHGEPNFPDPAYSVSSPAEPILALRGMFFQISPGTDVQSPAFRTAAAACGVKLPTGPGRVIAKP